MYIAKPYTIVLFGHREFNEHNTLEDLLYPLLKHLIKTKSFVRIYIGRNGEFDLYTATILKRVQKAIGKDNNELVCVLPYSHKDIKYFEEYYDDVIIPECIGKTHPKGAITKRNRWMVEQADLLICYVITTIFCLPRFPWSWILWATTSLPVPDSPVMSTEASMSAISLAIRRICRMAGLSATTALS